MTLGSLFFKSDKILEIGRGHGSEYGHIQYSSTLGHTKTRSEVLGQSLTRFGNNGPLNFFQEEW